MGMIEFGRATIPWDEVEPAAKRMFNIWVNGGELEWAKECWGHFEAAGLNDASTVLEGTKTLLRLVALADVYRDFCTIAWDENYDDAPISYLAEHLEISPIALGWLVAEVGAEPPDEALEDHDLLEPALKAVTSALRDEIHSCLSNAYGDAIRLYSRISQTNQHFGEKDDLVEFEVTSQNASALEFVQGSFRRY